MSAGRAASQRPMISSETPDEYTSAVSTRLPPASTNASSWACETSSSDSEPNVIVPRVSVETEHPLRPRGR